MADFDPSFADDAQIYWRFDAEEKSISVQWHNIPLWKEDDSVPDDRWDFQIKVEEDGTIHFYYFDVPKLPEEVPIINNPQGHDHYTQLMGIEDAAYQYDYGSYSVKPLEKVEVSPDAVKNKYIVVFKPKETCIGLCVLSEMV